MEKNGSSKAAKTRMEFPGESIVGHGRKNLVEIEPAQRTNFFPRLIHPTTRKNVENM